MQDVILKAHSLLGRCYREQGHFDKACDEYEKVVKHDDATYDLIHAVSFDLG